MAEFKLAMVFKNAVDKNVSMTIPDVKPTVTQAEAVALMDTILTTGIFTPNNIAMVSKVDCKMVETTTSDFYNVP
ncbi:DUF2922 domain-containing protein [Acetobacterium wieringae]|jgi:hypothetical protein|uniref:DUF2922 domain-containing protein n=1 Tax=Acetobacterium wieringae TaxID=52694 RepID=A0A5D0WMV5_9FIRM|nr:DUF2922 domain-containing protein [Acetobacterium wieringae]TYC85622.1 DUF2922 domain-containing protein [Acetobacterium wieringae]